MVSQMLTLNILLIPVITVFIANKKDVRFSFNLFSQYVMSAVLNVVCCKAVTILVRFFTESNLALDSGYYTIVAAIIAVVIGAFFALYKKYVDLKVEVSLDKTEEN